MKWHTYGNVIAWLREHDRRFEMGAALLRRGLFRLFIGVLCSRTIPFGSICAGTAPGQRPDSAHPPLSGSQPGLMVAAPGRFGLSPPAPPWTFARRFGTVSWEGRWLRDDRGDDEVLGTCVQRASGDAEPRDRAGVFGLEPEGAGAHRVRAVAVAAPEWEAEGPRCEAAVAGALSDASRRPPRRSPQPGAVCSGGRLRRGQSLPLFARSPADE